MVLQWRLTFLQQGQICFPMHLLALYIYMGKFLRIHILDISSKDYDPVELKLDEEHLIDTRQLKLMIQLKIQDGTHSRHHENQFLTSLSKPLVSLSRYFSVATGQLLGRNELKSWISEIQDGRHGRHIENLYWTSSRKPQDEWSWNL